MITQEMRREVFNAHEFMSQQPRFPVEHISYVNLRKETLSPENQQLSMRAMNTELENNKLDGDWRNGPRNFYDNTKNSDTQYAFLAKHNLDTTGQYRAKFGDIDKTETLKANDAAIGEMTRQHKKELSNALPEERPTLEKLHKFEKSYTDWREKSDMNLYGNVFEEKMAYNQVKKDYVDFKAANMGYEKKVEMRMPEDIQIKAETAKPQVQQQPSIQTPTQAPTPKVNDMASIQARMMKIRQDAGHGIKM